MNKIPKKQKSLIRLFNSNYRTKSEIVDAYEQTKESFEESLKEIKRIHEESSTTLNSYKQLEKRLIEQKTELETELRTKNHTINLSTTELKQKQKEYESLATQYANLEENLKESTLTIDSLNDSNKDLEQRLIESKSPLSIDVLKQIVGEQLNENYLAIKKEIINQLTITYADKLGADYNEHKFAEQNHKVKLKTLGLLASDETMQPLTLRIFDHNDFKILKNLQINFDEPDIYANELSKGFLSISFKEQENQKFAYSSSTKAELIFYVNKENQFLDKLRADAVDFVKAGIWGLTTKLLEQKEYETASSVILKNKLQDFAKPYLLANKDDKELMTYMKPVIDTLK